MNRVRVATVPDRHPYLDAALPSTVIRVHFPGAPGDPWALSPLLDPAFLSAHAAEIDVVHVHFGYEALTPDAMRAWLAAVRSAGLGLVVTVHDLRNPHDVDPTDHRDHLRLLLAAADDVVTLTPGAAAELARTYRRTATVLPHPTLESVRAPLARPDRARVVGLHLKSLRTNVLDPGRLALAAAEGAASAGATLQVDVHDEVVDRPELTEIRAAARAGRLDLRVHPRFDDAQLISYLGGLHASVLPYRFGSHSGWLELCRDLGTTVVVPDCGFYSEQWPGSPVYRNNEADGLDAASLSAAVASALRADRPAPADPLVRVNQRDAVRRTTSALYARTQRVAVA